MRAAGVTAVLALARAGVSPWLVLWWILIVVFLAASTVWLVRYVRAWWQRRVPRGWPSSAVTLIGAGCSLLVWGMSAGWATLP